LGGLFGEAEPEEEEHPAVTGREDDGEGFPTVPTVKVQLQQRQQPSAPGSPVDGFQYGEGALSPVQNKGPPRRRTKPAKVTLIDSDGSSDDDLKHAIGGAGAIAGACQPLNGGVRQLPTHVLLRVKFVDGVPAEDVEATNFLKPGRIGMAHFLDCPPSSVVTGTVAVIHSDESPPYEARRKRCVGDRRELIQVNGQREMRWDNEPGEVRVKLRPGESAIRAALVMGTDVVATTKLISLAGPTRRFFNVQDLIRPGSSGLDPCGRIRLAIELWPPGASIFDPATETDAISDAVTEKPVADQRTACGFCDGIGRKQCTGCFGHGVLVCTACDGTPALPCTQCKGTGVLETTLEVMSRHRAGTSVTGARCTACWGSSIACLSCFGMGGLRCAPCCGAGWTPCVNCVMKTAAEWY